MKFSLFSSARRLAVGGIYCLSVLTSRADSAAILTGVPDYGWYAGCFGTACGNLMGYWDRHGFPNCYTGPTAGGVAPLDSRGTNIGIRSMMASKAGLDGRPANQPGHIDDYWAVYSSDSNFSYESTLPDPYLAAGRPEHTADCLGDFIGVSQSKWTNMAGECNGNIDAYSFVYWDTNGDRRVNYVPNAAAGTPARDIQSGLREWTKFRGYDGEVFTQLAEFNPSVPPGKGFTFEDLMAEIDAGYPVMLFLQPNAQEFRQFTPGGPKLNPEIHGVLVFGYNHLPSLGRPKIINIKTSWGDGGREAVWGPGYPIGGLALHVRGVIGFRPLPKVTRLTPGNGQVTLAWDAPDGQLYDALAETTTDLHAYVVEKSATLNPPSFVPVATNTLHSITLPDDGGASAFFRVRLVRR